MLPEVFQGYFTQNCQIHGYSTRNSANLRTPLYRSMLDHISFHYNAVRAWNTIGSSLCTDDTNISLHAF